MANATKYVASSTGNNANTGDSFAQAYADLATALAAIADGGNTIYLCDQANYPGGETFPAGLKGSSAGGRNRLIGANSTGTVDGSRPTITSSTNSQSLFILNDNDYWEFMHLEFTHTAATRGAGIGFASSVSSPTWFDNCVFDGMSSATVASAFNSSMSMQGCEVKNCTSTNYAVGWGLQGRLFNCHIHDNAGDGIRVVGGTTSVISVQYTRIVDNGGVGVNGTTTNGNYTMEVDASTIANNGSDGLLIPANSFLPIISVTNNVIYGNTGYGVNNLDGVSAETAARYLDFNALGGNTSGNLNGLTAGPNSVSLSANPFTDDTTGDYSLNNTAGGGAECRYAGMGGKDIGALQHVASGGGGAIPPFNGLIVSGRM